MRTRLLSLALTLSMIISLLPMALAATEEVIVAPLDITVTTAKDDGLLVQNTEYYKNLDHAAASKLLADAKSGALTSPFVLLWHSRNCPNSKMAMSTIRKYAEDNKMMVYAIDQYNTLGGSVSSGSYLFKAVGMAAGGNPMQGLGAAGGSAVFGATTIVYPVAFAFDGKTLQNRLLAVPSFDLWNFADYMMELNFKGFKNAGEDSPVVVGKDPVDFTQLKAKWEQNKPKYTGELYRIKPTESTNPFGPGAINDGIAEDGLAMANFVRYVAHLPDDLVLDKTLGDSAQIGALVVACAGELTHFPPKHKLMDQKMYDTGYAAAGSSNLSKGNTDAHSAVLGYMSDSDVDNIDDVGHRRWILNPPLKKTGFGFSTYRTYTYGLMQATDCSRTEDVDYNFVSWPTSGYQPTETFTKNDAWSVSLNPLKFDAKKTNDIRVKLTAKDGTVTTFSPADKKKSGKFFAVATENAGIPFAVIFRPMTGYQHGDRYDVEITGVYRRGSGKPVTIKYSTDFVSLEGNVGEQESKITTEIPIRTQQELRAKWEQLKPRSTGSEFVQVPSVAPPYQMGKLTEEAADDGANMIQFMRYIVGRDDPVPPRAEAMDHDNQLLAFEMSYNSANGKEVFETVPADVTAAVGKNTRSFSSPSQISYSGQPGETLAENLKQSVLRDMENRRRVLVGNFEPMDNPKYGGIGLGHTEQGESCFEMWTRGESANPNGPLMTWPAAGNHPTEFIKKGAIWTLMFDSRVYDATKVSSYKTTVTGPGGTFRPKMLKGPECIEGIAGQLHLYFYPGKINYYPGDVYNVKIENIYKIGDNMPYTMEYTVNFFSLDPNAPPAPARSVTLANNYAAIKEGETFQIEPTVGPAHADQTVTYTVSDPSLGDVSPTGLVTSKKAGMLTVTVTAGSVSAKFDLRISSTSPTRIALNKTTESLTKNSTLQLNHIFIPKDTAGMVTYTSSNSSVATVTTNGLVTGVKAGTATITAKTGKISATCKITVKNIVPNALDLGAEKLTLNAGKTLLLEPVVGPQGAVYTVTYSSSDRAVASVSSKGLITPKKAGTATITAKAGTVTANIVITVEGKLVKGLTIATEPTKNEYKVGDKFNSAGFTATYSDGKTVRELAAKDMRFSNSSLTTVGNKTITATYNGLSVKFTVTVNKSVRPIEKPDPEEKPTPEEKPKPGGDYLVGASTWAKGEIQLATEVGLTFDSILNNYQKNITRAEFCKLAVNFHKSMGGEIPAVDQSPFTDTDDDDVLVANKLGIVNGTSATTFNPNADITREQIAAMMMRAIKKFDEPKVSNDLTKFADYKKISSYAVESLSYLNQEGIIKGLSAAEIAPLENTTREQASLIVYRTYTSLEPGSSPSTDSKSGTYKIVTATNSTNCIGVAGGSKANGTQLITWANVAAVSDQKFKIEPVGTKYSIKAVHSGKALAPSGAQKNGTKIVQKTYDGSAAQLYDIVDVGDGYVNFVSSDGYCISVSGGNTNQGVHIILWEKTGNTSQKFQLEKVN